MIKNFEYNSRRTPVVPLVLAVARGTHEIFDVDEFSYLHWAANFARGTAVYGFFPVYYARLSLVLCAAYQAIFFSGIGISCGTGGVVHPISWDVGIVDDSIWCDARMAMGASPRGTSQFSPDAIR